MNPFSMTALQISSQGLAAASSAFVHANTAAPKEQTQATAAAEPAKKANLNDR